jgi:hypothetical protein
MFNAVRRIRRRPFYSMLLAVAGSSMAGLSAVVLILDAKSDDPRGTATTSAAPNGEAGPDAGLGTDGRSPAANSGASGYVVPAPQALNSITAKAEVVLIGRLGRELGSHTVVFGQSTPLGGSQAGREIGIEVRSFELNVEHYVVGSGPTTIVFYQAAGGPKLSLDETGMFFLRAPIEWKLEGFSTTRSIYSVLLEKTPGAITYGDGKTPVEFVAGRSLHEIEPEIVAAMAR